MSNDDVGYGKPPKNTRFKAGVSGNPKGRPKRSPMALAEIVGKVLTPLSNTGIGARSKSPHGWS